MENKIVIGGWNVEIVEEHKIVQVDSDGFKFSKIFCVGEANWNRQKVYFILSGGARQVWKRCDSLEEMRGEYRAHLASGWAAF